MCKDGLRFISGKTGKLYQGRAVDHAQAFFTFPSACPGISSFSHPTFHQNNFDGTRRVNRPSPTIFGFWFCRDRARGGRLAGILDEFGSEDEEDRGRRRAQLGLREAAGGTGEGEAGEDEDEDDEAQGEVGTRTSQDEEALLWWRYGLPLPF